jgi:acetoin utilization deacetylase AcuC-like enzyme
LFLVEPTTALLADPIFREHLAGREHPERPERFDAVVRGLRQTAEATLAALLAAGRGA